MPDRLSAGAYSHKDFIEVVPMVNVGPSLPDPERDSFFLAPDCSDAELGETLQKAFALYRVLPVELEEARAIFAHAVDGSEYGKWVAERMARFGYKRKGQYFKRLHLCFVESVANTITISPTNHKGPDLWVGLGDSEDVRIPADSTPEEIGAALRLGFSRCWGRY